MTEYENRTKRGLDAALRALLREKPLDQIRVRELTERCGLRRQSFYYHFQDVYDLFLWCRQRERALLLEREAECLTWRQALLALLERAAEERVFYRAVLDRDGQEGLGELAPLDRALEAVQTYYRDRCGAPADAGAEALERQYARTMLLSMLAGWVRNELALPPEEIVASLERTVERSAAGAVWQTLREQGEWNWTP